MTRSELVAGSMITALSNNEGHWNAGDMFTVFITGLGKHYIRCRQESEHYLEEDNPSASWLTDFKPSTLADLGVKP